MHLTDATCVCTEANSGQCNHLAQNLIDLIPTLNSAFSTDFSPATLSKAVWLAQGDPGNSCVDQALLVDVAPGLDVNTSPNRTQWAQAALLWDLVESSNLTDVSNLRKFVATAPWETLGAVDGVTSDPSSKFTIGALGFDFNFAAQTVTAPPATFEDVGQPSSNQIGRVDDTARAALDRMYTFASGAPHFSYLMCSFVVTDKTAFSAQRPLSNNNKRLPLTGLLCYNSGLLT